MLKEILRDAKNDNCSCGDYRTAVRLTGLGSSRQFANEQSGLVPT